LLCRRKRKGMVQELNQERTPPDIVETFNAHGTTSVSFQQYFAAG
jgi:hypothetical protein